MSKVYSKTHQLKVAVCGHTKNIHKRGGKILQQVKSGDGFKIKYQFPSKHRKG